MKITINHHVRAIDEYNIPDAGILFQFLEIHNREQHVGIEPTSQAWKASIIATILMLHFTVVLPRIELGSPVANVGIEPTTLRVSGVCSTGELIGYSNIPACISL